MKKENNNISKLKQKLPKHNAPDAIWESVDMEVQENEKSKATFLNAVSQLPGYSAPDKAWVVINKTLLKKHGFILFNTDMLLKIAAAIIIILAIGFLLKDRIIQNNNTQITMADNTAPKKIEKPSEKKILSKEEAEVIKEGSIRKKHIPMKRIKVEPRIKVSELDAIAKTELVSMPIIMQNIIDIKKQEKGVSNPEKSHQEKSAIRRIPSIKKLKLSVHIDKEVAQKNPKRQFSFAFFRPLSHSKQKTDSIMRTTKPVFAATINL